MQEVVYRKLIELDVDTFILFWPLTEKSVVAVSEAKVHQKQFDKNP